MSTVNFGTPHLNAWISAPIYVIMVHRTRIKGGEERRGEGGQGQGREYRK